jgi:hypothetical protein
VKAGHKYRSLVGIAVGTVAPLALAPISAQAAAPAEACSLLSQQQVASTAGFSVGPGDKSFKTICTWGEAGKGSAGKSVQISFISEALFRAGKDKKSESGLGDEAYFIVQPIGPPHLDVRKGGVFLRVQARTVDPGASTSADEVNKEMAIDRAIARLIVPKL